MACDLEIGFSLWNLNGSYTDYREEIIISINFF